MKAPLAKRRQNRRRQQSDLVIDPDGSVHVSFLWDDLKCLTTSDETSAKNSSPRPAVLRPQHALSATLDVSIDEYRKCRLCPKRCGVNRIENTHPRCGDWRLRVATAGLSVGDEPEIAGTRGSGVVMLSGCPLTCPSCHNPEMVKNGEPTSAQDFASLCWDLAESGAHNLQLLSPTVHIPALLPILTQLKKDGFPIPVIFKSSGFEDVDQLRRFEGLVDVYLPDFKFGPCSQWASRAGVAGYFEQACAAINEMIRQNCRFELTSDGLVRSGVLVRHVRAPLPAEELQKIERALNEFVQKGARISILDNFVSLEA